MVKIADLNNKMIEEMTKMISEGSTDISITRLCNNLGIHRQTFYRYFPSKLDFYKYYYKEIFKHELKNERKIDYLARKIYILATFYKRFLVNNKDLELKIKESINYELTEGIKRNIQGLSNDEVIFIVGGINYFIQDLLKNNIDINSYYDSIYRFLEMVFKHFN